MRHEPLKDRALGRWRGILPALGVPAKALSNRHGPCPMCGGKDRFRFDDKGGRGTWICSKCGAGDGIELVKRIPERRLQGSRPADRAACWRGADHRGNETAPVPDRRSRSVTR